MIQNADAFDTRKLKIMADITSSAPDASPKGTIDTHIIPLITLLNGHTDIVTTSSCSGRVSVFLEGAKRLKGADDLMERPDAHFSEEPSSPPKAAYGGKGGGMWLYVSHDPIATPEVIYSALSPENLLDCKIDPCKVDISSSTRFVHFKFETMILHLQSRSLNLAHTILSTALSCGFRESGIMNPALGKSQYPTIAIRSNGLAMDSIIGVLNAESGKVQTVVNEDYIEMLVRVSNMRFTENKCRIQTLIKKLEFALFKNDDMDGWEDKEARRIRKRDEGMKRQMRARLCAIVSDDSENIVEDEIIGLAGIH